MGQSNGVGAFHGRQLTEHLAVSIGTPAAEFPIDAALVVALLADQYPDLTDLPLQAMDAGWDNAMFRLGDHLAVRLPRRAAAAPLTKHEQTWLPRLESRLTLPVPAPTRTGTPACGYPWHWSIVPWLSGQPADTSAPLGSEAVVLARFLQSLHVTPPADAPINPFRTVPLHERAAAIEERMRRLADNTPLITSATVDVWNAAKDAPRDMAPTWIHGDLHPMNVLVDEGRLCGIIDWGDMTTGDPATDLSAMWTLFDDPTARDALALAYPPVSEATIRRARGWALYLGVVLLDTGLVDNPRSAAIGERILRRLVLASAVDVSPARPDSADAIALTRALDEELQVRYPGVRILALKPHDADSPRFVFVIARLDGRAVACGAVRENPTEGAGPTGEVKRMYVRPECRGKGIARRILADLESRARNLGMVRLRIETGRGQPEAISLYRSEGYRDIPPFGDYVGNPYSVCFEKNLRA